MVIEAVSRAAREKVRGCPRCGRPVERGLRARWCSETCRVLDAQRRRWTAGGFSRYFPTRRVVHSTRITGSDRILAGGAGEGDGTWGSVRRCAAEGPGGPSRAGAGPEALWASDPEARRARTPWRVRCRRNAPEVVTDAGPGNRANTFLTDSRSTLDASLLLSLVHSWHSTESSGRALGWDTRI
jgi:hypothetical protein